MTASPAGLAEIARAVAGLLGEGPPTAAGVEDILSGLERLSGQLAAYRAERAETEGRIAEVVEVLVAVAGLDFSQRAQVSERLDTVDSLAAIVNMLGEELSASTVARAELELQVAARTSDLERSNAMLHSVIDSMGEGLLVTDEHGQSVILNRAGEQILGHGPVSREQGWALSYGVRHADGQRQVSEDEVPIARALRGEACDDVELVVRNGRLGADRVISASARPLRDEDGTCRGALAVFRDVTEARETERARAESEARFRRLFEDSPVPLLERDFSRAWAHLKALQARGIDPVSELASPELLRELKGEVHVASANRAAAALFELDSPEELCSRGFDAFGPGMAGALREMIRALLRGERETEGEGVIRTATGQEKRVAMRWSLHGPSHSTMLVSLVDITERKRVEDQLQRAREHAEEASRAKSDFLASMSHELRTPLNGVIGMTGFLLDTALSDEQRQYASTVRASADTLLGLVNNILDLSKIEAGMMDLEPVPFELSVLIEEVALLVGTTAHPSGVELVTRQAPGTPRFVRGDAGRIRQVLTNLAANALKFTSRGHVLMQLECLARANGEAVIRFSVEDTGIGIPAGKLESIFEKFTQADASTTRRYGGSGLGLTICKRLVELMGGTIGVRSQVGAGSTFSFTLRLPIVEGEEQVLPLALSGARALVVGGSEVSRQVLEEQLRDWGLQPVAAHSGAEALARLRAGQREPNPFRWAIVDEHLPDVDAFAFGRELQGMAELAGTHVVLLRSAGRVPGAATLAESGIAAVVVKPVRTAHLLEALHGRPPGPRSPEATRAASPPSHACAKRRALVAEDNGVNQQVATRMLERLGCRVDLAANGREAVEMARLLPYDLILMDCEMPEVDGFEAARQIRRDESSRGRRTPIVASTAHAMAGIREQCLSAGMDDSLTKPLRAAELARIVERWAGTGAPLEQPAPEPEPAEDVEWVDREAQARLRELSGPGDDSFFRELVEVYRVSSAQTLVALRRAGGDPVALAQAAHSLKGASASVGARAVAQLCERLERLGADRREEEARPLVDQLDAMLARTLEALQLR